MSKTAISGAVDAAKVFFNNEAERFDYINREMAIHDYESNMAGAREEGFADGHKQGMSQGIKKGKEQMVISMLKSGFLSIEQVAKISGLSLAEVRELAASKSI